MRRILVVVLVLSCVGRAAAEPVIIDRIAAVVNQDIITLSDVQEALLQPGAAPGQLPADPAAAERRLTPEALQQQLRLLIEERLHAQAAEQRGLTVTELELGQALDDIKSRNQFTSDEQLAAALAAERLTLDQYRERLRREILVAKLVNREVRAHLVVSPEELRRYYDQHADEFSLPTRVKLRQIVFLAPEDSPARVQKRTKALGVLEQLRNGADFERLARLHSDGPEAKDGGALGWFAQGALIPALDQAAFALPEGRVSELIETPAGYHLLVVEEREGRQKRPFEQVEQALRDRLLEEKMRRRYEEWTLELRRNAFVDIRW
ncbi:MAG: peptidyl-prolyl cis-trans isomerase [Nitrospirota bacterium]